MSWNGVTEVGRLGVFGGTFDPPHLGHLILAEEAYEQLGLERVLWVLTPDPPHKQGQSVLALEDRLQMLQVAISENPRFQLSRVDIDRPPPHYAVDTLRLLGSAYPQAELIYLIGGDSLRDLPTWHKPIELLSRCAGLGVMRRPRDRIDLAALEKAVPGIRAKTTFLAAPRLEISSSEIRQRIAAGRSFRYFLPTGVYYLIRERRLYDYPNLG